MTHGADGARILVVDDERAQMQALCETLTHQGYRVRGCGGGPAALELLREAPVDLLLADLMMPGMSGIELLREALVIDPAIAGVIMTGEGTITTAVEAMRTGAFDYILKPFKLSAVLPVLARGLAMRRLRIENAALERRLHEHAAELEAANKELDAFTRSASHDLKSPLNAVQGFAVLLLEQVDNRLSPAELGWLRNIAQSARHMNTLLEDLMRLSRMGRQSLVLRTVDVSALVRRVVDEIRQHSESARSVEVSIGVLPTVEADEGLLSQVFVNLLSNAFKFSARSNPPRVEVGAEAASDRPVYFVRDNGVGFEMSHANRLFHAFQRLPGASSYEGSGVGLSIVLRIVSRHGGRVWAESSPGQGACFRFVLGAPQAQQQALPA
jgi:signal transduction histidine kinase